MSVLTNQPTLLCDLCVYVRACARVCVCVCLPNISPGAIVDGSTRSRQWSIMSRTVKYIVLLYCLLLQSYSYVRQRFKTANERYSRDLSDKCVN